MRGKGDRFDNAPFLVINGKREMATERTCRSCGKEFLVLTKLIKANPEKRGLYCSKPCLYNRNRN